MAYDFACYSCPVFRHRNNTKKYTEKYGKNIKLRFALRGQGWAKKNTQNIRQNERKMYEKCLKSKGRKTVPPRTQSFSEVLRQVRRPIQCSETSQTLDRKSVQSSWMRMAAFNTPASPHSRRVIGSPFCYGRERISRRRKGRKRRRTRPSGQ